MKLNLYRRHRRDCKVAHPHNSVSSEFEERKKTWKRCSCPIFVSGTLNRKFHRMSTGEWEWEKAQAVACRFEKAGTWNNLGPAPSAPTAPQPGTERTTIEKAVRAYKAELTVSHAMTTIRAYGYSAAGSNPWQIYLRHSRQRGYPRDH